MKEYMKIVDENHTDYAACYQHIKWNVKSIAGYENSQGFIVQKFKRESIPANLFINDTEYFEAWLVEKGICVDTQMQKYDDEFAIGNPKIQFEMFERSLDMEGKYEFSGSVYWVDMSQDLYKKIMRWPTTCVEQAGGLHATYSAIEFDDIEPLFRRTVFTHRWTLKDPQKIYAVAKEILFRRCPNREKDINLFNETMYGMFGDRYIETQKKLRIKWEEGLQ